LHTQDFHIHSKDITSRAVIRVARFLLVQTYQNGKSITNFHKLPIPNGHICTCIISNGHKLYQTNVKYTNIFHSKALQNTYTQIWIFGLKINHLATLAVMAKKYVGNYERGRKSEVVNLSVSFTKTRIHKM
jgi:hypothetical protein